MTDGEPDPGDVRLDDQGNVEVFDGQRWCVVQSIYEDAGSGVWPEPDRAGRFNPGVGPAAT